MKSFFHRMLLNFVSNTTQFISKFKVPYLDRQIKSKDYRLIQPLLVPGQTILSRKNGELSTLLIPGYWTHAALIKDKYTVIEATTKGVIETDLIDFLMTKDAVVVLKPKFATLEEMANAVKVAYAQIGKPYQFDMEFSVKDIHAFYCSMLCYYSYLKSCAVMPFVLKKTLGIETVAPSDFVLAVDKFEVVVQSPAK